MVAQLPFLARCECRTELWCGCATRPRGTRTSADAQNGALLSTDEDAGSFCTCVLVRLFGRHSYCWRDAVGRIAPVRSFRRASLRPAFVTVPHYVSRAASPN
jgi:hypothetical protein